MRDRVRAPGLVAAGIALSLALATTAILFISEMRLSQTLDPPREKVEVPTDLNSVRRGQHLASAVAACLDCHGSNLAGKVELDDRRLGRITAPNLTRGRGGIGASFSDADLARAIRYGVDPSGRPLLIMPANNYNTFSDPDLGAIVGYIRSIPAIDSALPPSEVYGLGRVLFAVGQLPLLPATTIDLSAPRPAPPRIAVAADYGRYLADAAGCSSCHGPGLSGGTIPQTSPGTVQAANLTSVGLGQWSEADFMRVMRTGTRPDGRHLDASMPWPYYAQMTDDELRAVWLFLQAIPPRPTAP